MASNSQVHLFEEVSKHNKAKDCWVIINGKVYDVTPFMDEHPGGDDVLIASTGKDATNDFEDTGHSDSAKEMMDKYCIGEIDMATVPLKRPNSTREQPASATASATATITQDKAQELIVGILQFIVPLLIFGFAYAIRQYNKDK